jgi:hypothetical protein
MEWALPRSLIAPERRARIDALCPVLEIRPSNRGGALAAVERYTQALASYE